MGKTYHKYSEDEERYFLERYAKERREHRQEKRLSAALKRKNVKELVDMYEEDDYE
jgi:hypothetical protein